MRKSGTGAAVRTPTWPVSALKPRCLPITQREIHQHLKTSWSPAFSVTELCSPHEPPASSVDPLPLGRQNPGLASPHVAGSVRSSCNKTSEMNRLQMFHNRAHFPDAEVRGSGLALSRSDCHWLLGAEGLTLSFPVSTRPESTFIPSSPPRHCLHRPSHLSPAPP